MDRTSEHTWSPEEHSSLPQYGFGPEFTFSNLAEHNPFLFRVHTPKPRSPFFDSTEAYFVGPKFDEYFTLSPPPLPELCDLTEDVAVHMDWTQRSSSPYISTSFSFSWSMWEALRRYQTYVKHDIEIAVIDAAAVASHSVTALELLRNIKPKDRHRDYWKWYRFAVESQDVMVYGAIRGTAILASIPLLSLLEKLPSYFMSPGTLDQKVPLFSRLDWDAGKKPSFRQFCQKISERFLLMPAEHRLRDCTTQSVRLAMAFIRPWFQEAVHDDFSRATSKLCALSFIIAQWPGQWWVRDHGAMWDLIRATVNVLGEEVREKQRLQMSEEMERLQDVIDDLKRERIVNSHDTQPSDVKGRVVRLPRLALAAVPLRNIKPPTMFEAISCVSTGFIFGAFIFLCISSSQRRSVALHLT